MSTEDLERYEADIELQLYKEYKDVSPMFSFVVESERRFYLANEVHQTVRDAGGRTYVALELRDVDGTSVLAIADVGGLGVAETIAAFALPGRDTLPEAARRPPP